MSVNILGCTLEEYSDYVKLPIEALQQFGKSNGDWFGTTYNNCRLVQLFFFHEA